MHGVSSHGMVVDAWRVDVMKMWQTASTICYAVVNCCTACMGCT